MTATRKNDEPGTRKYNKSSLRRRLKILERALRERDDHINDLLHRKRRSLRSEKL